MQKPYIFKLFLFSSFTQSTSVLDDKVILEAWENLTKSIID